MDAETLRTLRSYLLGIAALVLSGIEAELLLWNHVKTPLQLLPVGVVAGGLGSIVWHLISRDAASVRIIKGVLCLCTILGALGISIHVAMNSNNHWRKNHGLRPEIETDAPPLAPAAMLPLGLLGIAFAFRHPALEERFGRSFQSITGN